MGKTKHFIHTPYQPGETVAAIATPPGEGGVAIVRISGHAAFTIAEKLFSGPVASYDSHTAHVGKWSDLTGRVIDEVLLLVMRGKRSYTGEDTVEVHCHGGSLITRQVLEAAIAAGARAAKPGEFTFKAFINGKIDLAQAEAVQELICAKSTRAMEAAGQKLQGMLSAKISSFQHNLTQVAAILEAWVDFPEEGLEFATAEELTNSILSVKAELERLLTTFHNGKITREGAALCLVGSPNVGKSSLMNALLASERAIVSDEAGTTRDLLEEGLRIGGLHFRLIDTAGIRQTQGAIEAEGVRRSQTALKQADLVLFVLDQSRGLTEEDSRLMTELPQARTVAIWNKSDLPSCSLPALTFPETVSLSAKLREGMDGLTEAIERLVWQKEMPERDEVMITSTRHKEALEEAIESLHRLAIGLNEELSPELLVLEIREALRALGKIIGTDITEDILSAIFSTFCVGK